MSDRLPVGKVPWDLVAASLGGRLPDEVVLGPAVGEDAALVRIGGELWAVASDPISFTAADAGRLVVTVNANDVAVRGAVPRLFLAVVLVAPEEASEARVAEILGQLSDSCERMDVALIGGHTEVTPGLPHSMVVGTMLGRVEGRPLTTGGLRVGDRVGMTKWAGLEGSSILLAEFGERLRRLHGEDSFTSGEQILAGDWLSVVPEALVAAANASVNALHDVTEGGVGEALHEMERASGLDIEVEHDRIPLLAETGLICDDLGIDPLGLIGSGALLVGCAPEGSDALQADLADAGVAFAWIGRAVSGARPGERPVPRFERDEILKAWQLDGIEAFIFDMDGTLIDSDYDWPAIRSRLGVTGASIIDELNGLPEAERRARWAELEEIERRATESARLKTGAPELLELLSGCGLATALVTNNTEPNTHSLLERFELDFDVVLTRDSGLWKPSGAPIREAMKRLGKAPEHCLAVGDSRYDVDAAHDAGCGRVCVLYGAAASHRDRADLAFADLEALIRYLRVVL
jgi:hydrogenase expression/formation protein HypE